MNLLVLTYVSTFMTGCQSDEIKTTVINSDITAVKEWFDNNSPNLESLNYTKKIDWENARISIEGDAKTIEIPLMLFNNTSTNVIDDTDYRTYMSLLFILNENE
ncbi:hypothetical protein [Flavobacterium collinsii]|uniref:hypothetical protein n=1 Tax=Flavobacterium collinsii TaxID=1114861 RepID=UPI001570E207|nr:hypothetical protein [Flavobacterium collinsii]